MAAIGLPQLVRRSPLIASALYFAAVILLTFMSITATIGVIDSHDNLTRATQSLDVLLGRKPPVARPAFAGTDVTGSPFIEGQTVTVAGAALLQRVAGAVLKAGGTVQSSQVDIASQAQKFDMVSVTVNCEVDPPALQGLLYDLESRMPFLFLDQLDVQVPQATSPGESRRMQLMMKVSGRWLPGK